MIHLLRLLIMTSALFSCSLPNHQSPRYIKLAHKITEETAKKIEAQKKLRLVGTGGQMMDDIQMMAMAFDCRQVSTLDEARALVVFSVTEYLSQINSSKELIPYLHEYPFTPQNIELSIYFQNSNGADPPLGEIIIASARKNKITYYIDWPEKYTIRAIHEESFQKALELVQNSKEQTP